ncbi:hypothetical protein CPS_4801 [Colwellia psychrerythraea 34H]|uniref:Uncharacterized protein n=1 Tax=Colwellia psychrerythraea (strain 34H / ATCC BAA-681) TaxID=167879 RepID=Q47UT2_COLP3|nr:hypothetical protein CPS_4801 [Colwellia psychrerythraea 34H]
MVIINIHKKYNHYTSKVYETYYFCLYDYNTSKSFVILKIVGNISISLKILLCKIVNH